MKMAAKSAAFCIVCMLVSSFAEAWPGVRRSKAPGTSSIYEEYLAKMRAI
jgi:hypothetical protein